MSDDVKALIARAQEFAGWLEPSEGQTAELIRDLADALEAAQQAPAVDREALARLIDPWAWDYGNPASPAVQMSRSVALAKADATIASGVASGILQDAEEVEARGLERLIERVTDAGVVQIFGGEKFVSVALLVSEARAQQVREGNA